MYTAKETIAKSTKKLTFYTFLPSIFIDMEKKNRYTVCYSTDDVLLWRYNNDYCKQLWI